MRLTRIRFLKSPQPLLTESRLKWLAVQSVLMAAVLCGALMGSGGEPETARAQWEGFVVTNETAPVFQKIPEIENQLYGHGYPNQAVSQRISRIERTLFGASQRGASEVRMQRINQRMGEKSAQHTLVSEEPMLVYLEEKLFQRAYPEKSVPERVHQLETQVFGHTFDNYPVTVRIKKLTYAMPIVAKEIRLTKNDDLVIASTGRLSQKRPRSAASAPREEVIQLDASGSNIRVMPNGAPLSAGDYTQSVFRNADGSLLRWHALPIKVYMKPEENLAAISQQALRAWQQAFSIQMVADSGDADVILTWDRATWDQNTTGLLTRPVMHVDDHRNIRTVILLSMYPLRGASPANQLHGLAHQLGHAFGIWGHSDDPGDVMYPVLKSEMYDYPSKWAWRSATVMARVQPVGNAEGYQPSQRDLNTLLKIYDLPATDLSSYSPY